MQNQHTKAVWALVCLLGLASYAVAEQQELTLANGDRYEGEVIDGALEGFGRYTWADGKRYEGNFSAGKRQGFGSLTWANGDRYQGNFLVTKSRVGAFSYGRTVTAMKAALWPVSALAKV